MHMRLRVTVFASFVILLTVSAAWAQSQTPVAAPPASAKPASPAHTAEIVPLPPAEAPSADEPRSTNGNNTSDVKPPATQASAAPLQGSSLSAANFEQVVDRVSASEQQFLQNLRTYTPLVETYLQEMKSHPDLGQAPA